MTWSSEKPTVDGWYWWRSDYDETPVPVYLRKTLVTSWGGKERWIENVGGEFAGPIPAPEEGR